MWGYGFSWGGMLLMLLSMALWIALLVVLVWAIIRWLDSARDHCQVLTSLKSAEASRALRVAISLGV